MVDQLPAFPVDSIDKWKDYFDRLLNEKNKCVVILPYYGEFGHFILHYVRCVEYIKAETKIVCCYPGDESFFPSATGFYYDWQNPFHDNERCGFRDRWFFTEDINETPIEKQLRQRLLTIFREYEHIRIDYPMPLERLVITDVPFRIKQLDEAIAPKLDVVICARHRQPINSKEDSSLRNWPYWEQLISGLAENGYKIGIVGKEYSTFQFSNASLVKSWNFPNETKFMFNMLTNCRLFIGTDTGPTHLATWLARQLIIFRLQDGSPDFLTNVVEPVTARLGKRCLRMDESWDDPYNILRKALNMLKE